MPRRQLSLLTKSHLIRFYLISFLLLVFDSSIYHHKKKILGLWPHCPGVRRKQVKRLIISSVCVCRWGDGERKHERLGRACEAHQA